MSELGIGTAAGRGLDGAARHPAGSAGYLRARRGGGGGA